MQTIASLANRLDMTPDEAVTTLRKLGFDIASVDTEISDDQIDTLIAIDEDPAVLDAELKKKAKEEEAKRKRVERLQQGAKKNAAKRKAAAKKKPAAKKKASAKAKAEVEIVEEAPAVPEIIDENSVVEVLAETPPAENISEEPISTPTEAPTEAPVADTAAPELTTPLTEEPPASEAPMAPPTEEPVGTAEGAVEPELETPAPAEEPEVAKHKPYAEILPAAPAPEPGDVIEGDESASEGEGVADNSATGLLAQAERKHAEEEKRRATRAQQPPAPPKSAAPPLPVPDPDVVAEVIRRNQEKERIRRGEAPAGAGRPDARGPRPAPGRDTREPRDNRPGRPAVGEMPMVGGPEKGAGEMRGPRRTGKTAKKKKLRTERTRALEDTLRRDAAAAVREFTAGGMLAGGRKKKRRRNFREEGSETETPSYGGTIEITGPMTVEQVSEAMEWPVNELILALMDHEVMATKNQVLEVDLIRELAEQSDYSVILSIPEEEDFLKDEPDDPADLEFRAPVITVMGHVDHGKTSFLDTVRKANVVAGEAGGITQHIAAYDVQTPNGRVAFLDTPGHEAFTAMRARGSQVTDIVVLVVAADDGVKPQTIEAIDHAKAAEVPVVVAVNKIDKPGAQPDRVRQELTQYGLVDEAWGGDTVMRNISALHGDGINELLEMLVLQAEMLELKANPKKSARAMVLESEISKGQGPVAWVLVQGGTLRVGDVFVAGETYGRVRNLITSRGENVQEAGPSTPILVTGFNGPAAAGDAFAVVPEERIARTIAEKRAAINKQRQGAVKKHITLEDFHDKMLSGEQKNLNIIIKADVQGSVDVLQTSFAKIGNEEVGINVVHSGVGGVNESDVMLASASDAVIIGFHVTANAKIQKLAEQEGVEVRTYRVIYEAMDELKKALEGLLAPDVKEVIVGHAEVRQVFRSSALGNIAGCMQVDGETERGARARLLRDDVVVWEGRIASVRRNKDDVKSVSTGFECGIKLERFDDVESGDVIETFKLENVAKVLA